VKTLEIRLKLDISLEVIGGSIVSLSLESRCLRKSELLTTLQGELGIVNFISERLSASFAAANNKIVT
jgi:hypothetical protein